jgi:hypothetical protein
MIVEEALTPRQEAIVVGSLLGDGAMRCKANALLEVNHCAAQRGYVDWKYHELANLVSTPPRERPGNGARRAYRFTTRSLPQLTTLFRKFYSGGRKVVPAVTLAPLTLAVWLMDDGSRSYNTIYLNTQQFTVGEQTSLLRMLEAQWGINGYLNKDKQYFRIRLSVASAARFVKIVQPLILPEFEYKLPVAEDRSARLDKSIDLSSARYQQ